MIRRSLHFLNCTFFTKLFLRFLTGGVAGYLFSMAVTFTATEVFKKNYLAAYAIATIIATTFNFALAMSFIFKLKDNYRSRFAKYLIFSALLYLLNLYTVNFLVETVKIHYLASITIATGAIFLLKFLIYDGFVFHRT